MSARSAAGPALEALWSRTKTTNLQTNGIAERFHKTVLDEFYRIAFRKRLYASIGDRPPPRRRAGLPPLVSSPAPGCAFSPARAPAMTARKATSMRPGKSPSAGRCRLFLADIHLHRARLLGLSNDRPENYPWTSPQHDLAEARRLIEKHGYGRRTEELEDAEAATLGVRYTP
jgi:hypothetical protein